MGIEAHLIHRCSVQRPNKTGQDAYGNDRVGFETVAEGVHCRLVTKQQRRLVSERVQDTVVTTYSLFVPADTDVREKDQIASLTDETGNVDARTFIVDSLLPRRSRALHHKTLALVVI